MAGRRRHGRAAPLPARVRRARRVDPARGRDPCGRRRDPADRRALPSRAAGSRHGRPRDAPARRLRAPLPRAAPRRRGLRLHGLRDPSPEQRRGRPPRAAPRRRGGNGRVAPRARVRDGRPPRELGRGVALRVLPRAGGEAAGRAPGPRPVGRSGSARRDRHAGGRRARPPRPASRGGQLHARPPRSVGDRRGRPDGGEPAARHVRPAEWLPPDGGGRLALRAGLRRRVPGRAACTLRAHRPARARLVRGGGVLPREAEGRRPERGGAHARDAAGPPAPISARLPDARRSALPRPAPRPVAAPARLHLLVRTGPGPRELRRGDRTRDERPRLALDVVGARLECRAGADAARRRAADARRRGASRHRHLSRRVPPGLRRVGGARQGLRRARGRRPLSPSGERRGRRSTEARGGRGDPPVAARALARVEPLARLSIGHYMLRRWSLEEDVRALERLGFRSISLASTKLEAYGRERALRLLRASTLKVAHVGSYGWFGTERRTVARGVDRVRRAIDWTARIGADALFVISGPRDGAGWNDAARAYGDAYARLLPEATAAGIRLAIEVIHPLRQDLSFVNTLADAREIATRAGPRGGYVLDFFHSGWERGLLDGIRRDAARRIHAVQVSDYKRATMRTMDRALLCQGILPLQAMIRALEDGGYLGWYEIEIISDDVDRMGYERVLRHTRRAMTRLLGAGR